MSEPNDVKIMPGRIQAIWKKEETETYWDVPLMSKERKERLIEELAHDPLFAGRLLSGSTTEDDRRRAGVGESGWRPVCSCGMRMPCRHAQSVLFQFRNAAKRNPLVWLEASGADVEAIQEQYRMLRAVIVQRSTGGPEQRAMERAAEMGSQSPRDHLKIRLQYAYRDPDFWNRDVSMAEWLRPMMEAVMAESEQEMSKDADPSDDKMDPNLHKRP